jgi:2-polyprenyl-3-methyl-5-hydroxy-6-metoxy-1,4-benzoquinol methylase
MQPLARMGGQVTGVDAVEKNIGVASIHAVTHPSPPAFSFGDFVLSQSLFFLFFVEVV